MVLASGQYCVQSLQLFAAQISTLISATRYMVLLLCGGCRHRLFRALDIGRSPAVVDSIVPSRPHDGDILLDQFLFLLELPLNDTIEGGSTARYHKTFPKKPILHGLIQSRHTRQACNRTD